jgi:hypothetical protein
MNPQEINSQRDLSQLTKRQLHELARQLRGTPEVQPVYREISRRPGKISIKLDDPNWDEKFAESLTQAFKEAEANQ